MAERLTLVAVVGMPGTGKSTLAIALSQALKWPTIDKDILKSTLLAAGMADGDANLPAYELMYALARHFLTEQALSVILDSPDPSLSVLQNLANETGAMLKIVLCVAEREIRNRRVAERNRQHSQPVRESKTQGDGRERYRHLPEDTLLLSTEESLAVSLKNAMFYLLSSEREHKDEATRS